ncbi:MAG: phage/plasmid primase, P4 family [Phycisphaerales bacterium]
MGDADTFRAKGIDHARRIWKAVAGDQAGVDHARVREYLEARGIELGALPGHDGVAKAPESLRYLERCYDGQVEDVASSRGTRPTFGPAMLAFFVDAQSTMHGVHRTFLDPGGLPRKRDEAIGTPKKMLGACKGRAIRLTTLYPEGVLVLAEGIETALAVSAATGWGAWAAGSAPFMPEIVTGGLPDALFTPASNGGRGVHTLVIAADLNRTRLKGEALDRYVNALAEEFPEVDGEFCRKAASAGVGERAAIHTLMRVAARWPWVTTRIAVPSIATAGNLVKVVDGREVPAEGSGLDWLDVVRGYGGELREANRAVGGAIRGLVDVAANAKRVAEWPGGFEPLSSQPPLPQHDRSGTRADRPALGGEGGAVSGRGDGVGGGPAWDPGAEDELPVIENGAVERARRWLWEIGRIAGASRFAVARWGGEWWVYRGGRYVRIEDERLRNLVWHWLNGFAHFKGKKIKRLEPNSRTVEDVLRALAIDTAVIASEMPARLPAVIDPEGVPMWGLASSLAHLDPGQGASAARAWEELRGQIVLLNGVIDVGEVARTGRVKLRPHTPDVLNATCLPFELPVAKLQALVDGCDQSEVFGELCPYWWRWLADASEGDPDWERQLQEMMGDTISLDRSIEKVFLAVGKQRAGKGYIQDALAAIAGEENVMPTTFQSLTADRFALYPLVGKSVVIMPDAHLGSFAEGAGAVEILKTISGRDRVQVRDLYATAKMVKLHCRIWIFSNDEPDLRDDSSALARRLIVLPLRKSAEGREDPRMKASVPQEAAGILLWALLGAIRLAKMQIRRIDVCGAGRAVQDEFEARSAHLRQFKNDCLVEGPDATVEPKTLYDAYCYWCEHTAGREPVGRPKFFSKIKWHIDDWEIRQPRVDGGRVRLVHGVALRDGVRTGTQTSYGPQQPDIPF